MSETTLRLGWVQMAPVWLDRQATTTKMLHYLTQAAEQGAQLLAFGEALLPGYPYWLDYTGGARFNNQQQKEAYAWYASQAVQIERGDLVPFQQAARRHAMALLLGIIERPQDRGGHSLYCSMVYIDAAGEIQNVHRKLQPTYEERLVWSPGDGHGLRTFSLGPFTLGGLNCWENWMPLPRAALYGQGENLHVASWPGSLRNTEILTRFLAREGRSYTLSVSGLFRAADIPDHLPQAAWLRENAPARISDGGSCLAGPDGNWLVEPRTDEEFVQVVTIDYQTVLRERQNFDPAGHYSRPDVTQLHVNRERQGTLRMGD
ncbi:MAG: carbon-nitrogen hydrolase family protein [Bacteroidota bacterium]